MKKYVILLLVLSVVYLNSCSKPAPKHAAPGAVLDYSELVRVPGGTFLQSDGAGSFTHTISTFEIGKYEVTYDLWHRVFKWAAANGYVFAGKGMEGNDGWQGAEPTEAGAEPVTLISWRDVIVWCNAYSRMSGLKPVYYSNPDLTKEITDSRDAKFEIRVNPLPGSCDNPYADWASDGYRLPTEGEWQYAAGYTGNQSWMPYDYPSGSTADFDDPFLTDQVAWYYSNSDLKTKAAGLKNPNKLGIYDMSGNVYEWCWDWYSKIYPAESTDYRGPPAGASRVRRGGSYHVYAYYTPVGYRFSFYPYHGDKGTGFRVVKGR
jgi:sulfatase modifying factor 1